MDEIAGLEPRKHARAVRWIGGAAAVGIGITLGAAGIAAAADPSPTPSVTPHGQGAPPGAPPGGPGMRHLRGPRVLCAEKGEPLTNTVDKKLGFERSAVFNFVITELLIGIVNVTQK